MSKKEYTNIVNNNALIQLCCITKIVSSTSFQDHRRVQIPWHRNLEAPGIRDPEYNVHSTECRTNEILKWLYTSSTYIEPRNDECSRSYLAYTLKGLRNGILSIQIISRCVNRVVNSLDKFKVVQLFNDEIIFETCYALLAAGATIFNFSTVGVILD